MSLPYMDRQEKELERLRLLIADQDVILCELGLRMRPDHHVRILQNRTCFIEALSWLLKNGLFSVPIGGR